MKFSDVSVAVAVLVIVLLIIVPLPVVLMDFFLILNIAGSLMIVLITLYVKKTLDFSTYPTVLLIITLFRMALNIAATRLILGNSGDAGQVIKAFGTFVVGDNIVVGLVIFFIIVIMQFIVITKGSERVAEVSARFTLDAMPGKQMAIDADLSSGIINESQAKERRQEVQEEANFYGSMDGASKFVKGDSIMGIIITFINIIGGILIGLLGVGGQVMSFEEVVRVYIVATIGNGICSQISALLVSTATGIIVTRSSTKEGFGRDVMRQMFNQKTLVFYVLAGMLAVLSFIPGLPTIPILLIAASVALWGYYRSKDEKKIQEEQIQDTAETVAAEKRKPESDGFCGVLNLLLSRWSSDTVCCRWWTLPRAETC